MKYKFISKIQEYQFILSGGDKKEVNGQVLNTSVQTAQFEPTIIPEMGGITLGLYETSEKKIADRLKRDPTFGIDFDEFKPQKPKKPMTENEVDKLADAMKAKIRKGNKVTLSATVKEGEPEPVAEPTDEPDEEAEEE